MNDKLDFSKNLRHLSAERGTVAHICRELGVNRQQYDRYIKGSTLPTAHNLRRIASYFDVPDSELFEPHDLFLRNHRVSALPLSDDAIHSFVSGFSDQVKPLRRYLGFYHIYAISPSWEGRILRNLTQLCEKDGLIAAKTIQRATSRDQTIRQRSRFEGLATYRGNCIFVVESEAGVDGSVVETILFPAHRQQVNYLRGLTLGVASRPRFTPYASRTIWKRIGARTSIREAINACGAYGIDSREIDPTIRKFLNVPAQTLVL